MTRLEEIEVWRAFFNDYRDLSKGLLLKVGSEPYIYSNMASDFEVINKLHLDLANEKITQLQSENTHLKEQIRIAEKEINRANERMNGCCYRSSIILENVLAQLNEKKESR